MPEATVLLTLRRHNKLNSERLRRVIFMTDAATMDPKMLSVLICPKTGSPLSYDSDKKELISKSGKLAFPVREGVPILLLDEARPL